MSAQPKTVVDQAKVEAFVHKAMEDASAAFVTVMCSLGDRLGLFKDLAAHGPATSSELAARTSINERYAREWLGAMTSAGYLRYDGNNRKFTMPPEHVPVLADENGPFFFGGLYHMMSGMLGPLNQIARCFKEGGGIPQAAYDDNMWDGLERFTAGWFENLLLQQWIPAMPIVQEKLTKGCSVADVGCGRGRAVIKLSQAFPNSRYTGYDIFGPTVARASAYADVARVSSRVKFRQWDVAKGLPEKYDIITTFDVIHDAVDPSGLIRSIRQALNPGGRYICLDINCSDKLEENAGPLGAMFQSVSVLYCMTTSLAHNGAGLGTVGLPESKLREFANQAGFADVRRVPIENPFNNLYELTP
ncbi:MAG: methyltransferase domain-containing protein [Acidobacteria bacterium]|nr:methyltransferase domain-containing protein [Acidobacteriota bacterium]